MDRYFDAISFFLLISLINNVIKPIEVDYAKHVYHLYVIRSKKRDQLKKHLEKHGIGTLIHYPLPIHKQTVYREYNNQKLEVSEKVSDEILSLPMYPELKKEEIEKVSEAINNFE